MKLLFHRTLIERSVIRERLLEQMQAGGDDGEAAPCRAPRFEK